MKQEMSDWVVGVVIFLIFSTIIYGISVWLYPHSHFSWLESFGWVMMGITLKSGVDTYYDSIDDEE
jgi:hypothetical protein